MLLDILKFAFPLSGSLRLQCAVAGACTAFLSFRCCSGGWLLLAQIIVEIKRQSTVRSPVLNCKRGGPHINHGLFTRLFRVRKLSLLESP